MGRHEQPVPAGALHDFAAGLRALRAGAGSPAYREMSRTARYSSSALSAAASGQGLPTWELTLAYVRACGGDEREWRERWQAAAAAVDGAALSPPPPPPADPADPADPAPVPVPGGEGGEERPGARSARTVVKVGAGPLIIALALVLILIFNNRPAAVNPIAHGTTGAGQSVPAMTTGPGPATSATASAAPLPPATASVLPSGSSAAPVSGQGGAPAVYDRTEGPGCAGQSEGAVFQDQPINAHPWTTTTGASWPAGPCLDTVLVTDPSTNPDPDHWQNDYGWHFGQVPADAACTFAIYIPDTPDSRYTAAYFWSPDGQYTDQEAFTLDQGVYQGQWATRGPLTFPTGTADLELTDARTGGPIAPMTASLVRLTCS